MRLNLGIGGEGGMCPPPPPSFNTASHSKYLQTYYLDLLSYQQEQLLNQMNFEL